VNELLELTKIENDDWIFIDWLDEGKINTDPALLVQQAEILESAVKQNLITLIFDRNLSLKEKEINWLSKFNNVVLLEPALNYRQNFVYLPFGVNIPKDFDLFEKGHRDDLYYSSEFNDETKKFYEDFTGNNPEITLSENLEKSKYTVLVPSAFEASIGYLPDIQVYLKHDVIPLLHYRSKYFVLMFRELTLYNQNDLKNLINIYPAIDWALMKSLYDRIDKFFPEMKIQNVVKKIKNIVEEKRKCMKI